MRERLEAGEGITGFFAPASAEGWATPGVLTWSNHDGATLELADRSDPWPSDFDTSITVHARPHEGEVMTLLDTMVRSAGAFGDRAFRLSAGTLALGAHITPDTRWSHSHYRPGTLHEWRPDTGLSFSRLDDSLRTLRVDWQAPTTEVADVRGGQVRIYPGQDSARSYGPGWSIETLMTYGVRSSEPLTMNEHWSQFGNPLLVFSMFAADAPDDLVHESYSDPETNLRVVVLRAGRRPLLRDWRPVPGHLLFLDEDVPDIAAGLQAWFRVWDDSRPALGLFGEVIDQDATFSAPRFLTLYTAAEAYWKNAWRAVEGGAWGVRRLVEHAGDAADTVALSKDSIALIGETRSYHAHLGSPRRHTVEHIVETTYESTRRLHALLQACLLRDIGIGGPAAAKLLRDHYRSWPLP